MTEFTDDDIDRMVKAVVGSVLKMVFVFFALGAFLGVLVAAVIFK